MKLSILLIIYLSNNITQYVLHSKGHILAGFSATNLPPSPLLLAENYTNSTNRISDLHLEYEGCKPLFAQSFPYFLVDRVRLPPLSGKPAKKHYIDLSTFP